MEEIKRRSCRANGGVSFWRKSTGLQIFASPRYIVKDGAGQSLAYVYFEEESGRRAAAKLLTRDEARRIAVNIAKLPGLLQH